MEFHLIYTDKDNINHSELKHFICFNDAEKWLRSIGAKYWEIGIPDILRGGHTMSEHDGIRLLQKCKTDLIYFYYKCYPIACELCIVKDCRIREIDVYVKEFEDRLPKPKEETENPHPKCLKCQNKDKIFTHCNSCDETFNNYVPIDAGL